jgi:hypothetical protein
VGNEEKFKGKSFSLSLIYYLFSQMRTKPSFVMPLAILKDFLKKSLSAEFFESGILS